MIYPDSQQQIPANFQRVHFVGIGGSGMHGIARMMHERGLHVTGSDRAESENTKALAALGIKVSTQHLARHAQGAELLVVTGALSPENPEYQFALANNIPVVHRSKALAWLAKGKKVVAVAGAHGKTTSTTMLTEALLALQAEPSFVSGGVITGLGVSAKTGSGELFVLEADESDKSFLLYDTDIALITNVDPEHLDFYGSREAFMAAFVEFATKAKIAVVLNIDDPGCREVLAQLPAETNVVTFGSGSAAAVRLSDVDAAAQVKFSVSAAGGAESADVCLNAYGAYNAVNATGAIAVLTQLGYTVSQAAQAVASFSGAHRRFQHQGTVGGVRIYDDYAHHPTEVAAVLTAARAVAGQNRVIAVLQPHLYSRTQHFHREFAKVLETGADFTVVLPIDPAREEAIAGVSGNLIADAFTKQNAVCYVPDWHEAVAQVAAFAAAGDVIVTMSPGSVKTLIVDLLAQLGKKFSAKSVTGQNLGRAES